MKCTECKIDYPFGYVQLMYSSEGTKALCGECYRIVSNRFHGINRKKLDGPIAEELRQKALAFRREIESGTRS
jgi:hypothetical protein